MARRKNKGPLTSARRALGGSFRPSKRLLLRGVSILVVLGGLVGGGKYAPDALGRMSLFEMTHLRVENTVYLDSAWVAVIAGLGPSTNIWHDRGPWLERLQAHPMVRSVRISRRPPGTLAFHIEEARPIALVASPVLVAVDAEGNSLPIDPARPILDLPILTVRGDSLSTRGIKVLARELARISASNPEVFAVVSEARHEGDHVMLSLGESGIRVLYAAPILERRLLEAVTVMNDALGRFPERKPREIDLRYEDQVIVRYSS